MTPSTHHLLNRHNRRKSNGRHANLYRPHSLPAAGVIICTFVLVKMSVFARLYQ